MKAIAIVLLLAAIARADDHSPRVDVEVGQTVERNAGTLHGWRCDDPTLIHGDLVTRGDVNIWVVTGEKVGTTQCRVGTELYRPGLVFDVIVIAAKKKPT